MSITHRPAINIKSCDRCGSNDLEHPELFYYGGTIHVTRDNNTPGRPSASDSKSADLCSACVPLAWSAMKKITCKGIEIEPGVYSGCDAATTGAEDCPECGGKP